MSPEQYIRQGTAFSILHRLAATRCVFLQYAVDTPAALLAMTFGSGLWSYTGCATTIVFVGLFNILMHRYGWYNLPTTKLAHIKAAESFDCIVNSLLQVNTSKRRTNTTTRLGQQEELEIDVTFKETHAISPPIPQDLIWLVGDIM